MHLERVPTKTLECGQVGYVIAGIETIRDIEVGTTITLVDALARPVRFSSMYAVTTDEHDDLSKALEKMSVNDAGLVYAKDVSAALGFGFRCGFLGLLHQDVIQSSSHPIIRGGLTSRDPWETIGPSWISTPARRGGHDGADASACVHCTHHAPPWLS